MTTQASPNFIIKPDPLHTWAMDLAHHASRLTGYQPSHTTGHYIYLIAAAMEEQAALQQPEENLVWKAILHRSAAWMYLKAAPSHQDAVHHARRMATTGLDLGVPGSECQFNEVLEAVTSRMTHDFHDPDPEPWITCCLCHRHISWSQYPPRDLTAHQIDDNTIVARMCSQCEWDTIAQPGSPAPGSHQVLSAHREVFDALTILEREQDANSWLINRLSRKVADQEKAALVEIYKTTDNDMENAILLGQLIPFGVSPLFTGPTGDIDFDECP